MQPFYKIMFVFYLILGVIYITHYVRVKLKARTEMNKLLEQSKTVLSGTKGIPLSNIRNQYFPIEDITNQSFFINEYMEEAFNVFLKISPTMISTLTKADRRLVNLKSMVDNELLSETDLKHEIESIDMLLDQFIQVSHQMIEKLEEVISNNTASLSSSQISVDAVKAYMGAVNVLTELTDNHSVINYQTHYKLSKKYPDLVEPFRIIAGKITYLFFINLITYSTKIDENIILYN